MEAGEEDGKERTGEKVKDGKAGKLEKKCKDVRQV